MKRLLDFLLTCKHVRRNFSFPHTETNKRTGEKTTTVVCFDCGKPVDYNFANLGGLTIPPPKLTAPRIAGRAK